MHDFTDWLIDQAHRDDPIGDLARDARDDHKKPLGGPDDWRAYLAFKTSSVVEALEDAIEEYQY